MPSVFLRPGAVPGEGKSGFGIFYGGGKVEDRADVSPAGMITDFFGYGDVELTISTAVFVKPAEGWGITSGDFCDQRSSSFL
jgi:hypothetical protein